MFLYFKFCARFKSNLYLNIKILQDSLSIYLPLPESFIFWYGFVLPFIILLLQREGPSSVFLVWQVLMNSFSFCLSGKVFSIFEGQFSWIQYSGWQGVFFFNRFECIIPLPDPTSFCWEIGWLSCRSPLVCDKPLFSYCFQDSLFVALGILILMCFNVGLFKIELTWRFLKFLKLSSRLVRFRKFSVIVPSYKLSVPFSFAFCDSHNASVALHGGVP